MRHRYRVVGGRSSQKRFSPPVTPFSTFKTPFSCTSWTQAASLLLCRCPSHCERVQLRGSKICHYRQKTILGANMAEANAKAEVGQGEPESTVPSAKEEAKEEEAPAVSEGCAHYRRRCQVRYDIALCAL
eukprot:508474-Rhodomonas_salina.2